MMGQKQQGQVAMKRSGGSTGGLRVVPALLAAAGMLAAPVAGTAAVGSLIPAVTTLDGGYVPFTPASIDPSLARKVAATLGLEGLRFTPAPRQPRSERLVTMAVRVDRATARAITVRRTLAEAGAGKGDALGVAPLLAPTRYNLGSARGFQTFAAPTAAKALAMPMGIRDIAMADIATYRLADSAAPGKPSRLQPRIAFEENAEPGRAPRTFQGASEPTVDVGGSYRVLKNLNVTAGVRVSQERNRLAPLTDGVADDKAVYVGTQFKF